MEISLKLEAAALSKILDKIRETPSIRESKTSPLPAAHDEESKVERMALEFESLSPAAQANFLRLVRGKSVMREPPTPKEVPSVSEGLVSNAMFADIVGMIGKIALQKISEDALSQKDWKK